MGQRNAQLLISLLQSFASGSQSKIMTKHKTVRSSQTGRFAEAARANEPEHVAETRYTGKRTRCVIDRFEGGEDDEDEAYAVVEIEGREMTADIAALYLPAEAEEGDEIRVSVEVTRHARAK